MQSSIDVRKRLTVFSHAFLFVLGFSLVFIIGWGGAATLLGQVFGQYKDILAKVGGIFVVILGLSMIGIVNIPFLNYDTRPQWGRRTKPGWISSFTMGIFFAAGWTPCIGTTLGAILTLGLSQDTSLQAMYLASGYAIGLGLPFLILGFLMEQTKWLVGKIRTHIRKIQIISGITIIAMGVLMVTNQMFYLAIWAQRNGLFLDLNSGRIGQPDYFVAILAGTVSFLSPCVLPLVPAYIGYLGGQTIQNVDPL
jgi:cytochrome c-type biogenesis protein